MCASVFHSYSFGIWVLTQEYTTMVVDKHAGSFSFPVEFCWPTTRGHSFYDNGYNFTQLFSHSLFCPCLHMCSLVHMYMFVCILLSAVCLCLFWLLPHLCTFINALQVSPLCSCLHLPCAVLVSALRLNEHVDHQASPSPAVAITCCKVDQDILARMIMLHGNSNAMGEHQTPNTEYFPVDSNSHPPLQTHCALIHPIASSTLPPHHQPQCTFINSSVLITSVALSLLWTHPCHTKYIPMGPINTHPVFHASLLLSYCENNVHRPNFLAPPPNLITREEEYKIEKIICHKGITRMLLLLDLMEGIFCWRRLLGSWKGSKKFKDHPCQL